MKVTVFGATGTIGRALVPELAREHDVTAVSRESPRRELRECRSLGRGGRERRRGCPSALGRLGGGHYLVHSLGERDFAGRDRRAASVVAAEAERERAADGSSTSADWAMT